jgi:hypothetical protein
MLKTTANLFLIFRKVFRSLAHFSSFQATSFSPVCLSFGLDDAS